MAIHDKRMPNPQRTKPKIPNSTHTVQTDEKEAQIICKQCYIQVITYPITAAFIDPINIKEAQDKVTSQFLCSMGYSHSFPHAVLFVPTKIGGLRLCHIRCKQEVQKILFLLKHCQTQSTQSQILNILIDSYMLANVTQLAAICL